MILTKNHLDLLVAAARAAEAAEQAHVRENDNRAATLRDLREALEHLDNTLKLLAGMLPFQGPWFVRYMDENGHECESPDLYTPEQAAVFAKQYQQALVLERR